MTERPRFIDDLAGVAGGAFSALAGMREEAEATIRARIDEAIRKLDLVKREDLEAVQEMAALARAGQEAAERRLAAVEGMERRLAGLEGMERRLAALEAVVATMGAPALGDAARSSAPGMGTGIGMGVSGTEAAPAAVPPATTDGGTPVEPPMLD